MSACTHCDEEIIVPIFDDNDQEKSSPFCCNGCLTVFHVLHEKGLENYYEIKNQSNILKRRSPVENKKFQFKYLDDSEFIKEYTYSNLEGDQTIEFYLEGIHCLACLWLIEKLPEFLKDVKSSRLDINRSVATVAINKNGQFSNVARELNNLGYKPHALKRNQELKDFKRKEERKMMLKIGIAGAGAGNIMLYAISIYAGADGNYAKFFNLMTILFAIPVLFYSATPFYSTAWNAIKNKTLSIDIPISMSLIMGTIFGFYNLFTGVHENYLDGLTALIFLLLLSRYFLNRIQSEGLTASDLSFFYQGQSVLKKVDNRFIETNPQFLTESDIIKVQTNQILPVDGIIVEGATSLNNSLLTGESRPEVADIGCKVYSGTMNLGSDILVKVEKTNHETRLGKILKQVESGWIQKAHIVEFTNRISKYFLITVLLLSASLFAVLASRGNYKDAFERALTLLIVTCPCALALATPLTLTRTLSRASKKGIIIKNDEVIEKLSQIDSVFLDKTGTITFGQLKISNFKIISPLDLSPYDIIISLEKLSQHPVAHALKEYAHLNGAKIIYEVQDLKEILGIGVEGKINGKKYQIISGQILEEGKLVATFCLDDKVRPDSKSSINQIKSLGINVSVISGDQKEIVEKISNEVGINLDNTFAETTPEKKLLLLENTEKAVMVGDGANDAMALSKSYVSIAVMGAMDISLRAADVYLSTPGILPVAELIVISKETMKVVRRNLILSLLYNSFSVYAAFTGMISPLVAAIVMPVSSLTVLLSTVIGTKKLNQKLSLTKGF
jgi:heavy metal-(Cd/Co/Hg/Pb/Zn)-translocating P-type ATPase